MSQLNSILPITTPVGIDLAVLNINTYLSSKISWLTNAYGVAEKKISHESGKDISSPEIYTGIGNEYIGLFPDENLGNYCFWTIENPVINNTTSYIEYTPEFEVIVWFDFNDIYGHTTSDGQRLSNVIKEFVDNLNKSPIKAMKIKKIETDVEDIYKKYTTSQLSGRIGFSSNQARNQFPMRPYGVFKIIGTFIYEDSCN